MPTSSNHFNFDRKIFRVDNSQELRYLYLIRFVNDFTSRLSGFFIPLYLFELRKEVVWFDGVSLSQLQAGVMILALYYFLMRLSSLISTFPIGRIIANQGTRFAMLASNLARAVWITSLLLSLKHPAFIFLSAIAWGLQINLFYNPYLTLLSRNTKKKNSGKDLGITQLLLQLAAVIAPALGGTIIAIFGFEVLFLVSFFSIFINILAITLMKNHTFKSTPSIKELRGWLQEKQYRLLNISYAGRYIHDGVMTIWPLYIFLILGSIEKVGYLYSLSLFLATLIIIFTGFYVDHNKNKKPYFFSGGLISMLWLIRTQVWSIWSITIVDTLDKMTGSFHWLYYDSMFFKRAKGSRDLAFFVYREMMASFFAIFFWIIVAVIFLLPGEWRNLFIFASLGALMTLVVSDKYDHQD